MGLPCSDTFVKSDTLGSVVSFGNFNKSQELQAANEKRLGHIQKLQEVLSQHENVSQRDLGINILEVLHSAYVDELGFIEKGLGNSFEKNGMSVQDVKEAAEFTARVLEIQKDIRENLESHGIARPSDITFEGKRAYKQELTETQRKSCHASIHTASAICAGISAALGEANLVKADVPFLIATEAAMFTSLATALNADPGAAVLHGFKHGLSAGMIGMSILKEIYNIGGLGAHIASITTTGGAGNLAVTGGIRAGSAALSATMCEAMGWAFVNDYKKGKMNMPDKTAELVAFLVFAGLTKGFDSSFDLEAPAIKLEESAAKALGGALVKNMPPGVGHFIEGANAIAQSGIMSFGAKGLEIVTPALASHVIENRGKIGDDAAADILKGALFSLVCTEAIGEANLLKIDKTAAMKKIQPLMKTLMHDPQINSLVKNEMLKKGIMQGGQVIFNKNTAKAIESLYNDLTPILVKTAKNMRSV
ncbi:hypothetical protein tpqmel_0297 [Candidatus Gastranaerophilus sp. (ex Termes propinquus)]|nr:hypothetical protein tpqmel_0297 [Candidatus Gastranaerophilus sp. (ex Termes propinquus)]